MAAMAAVFGRVCGHQFLIWDDNEHVVANPHLNPPTWRGVRQLWREPYWGLYIPLSYTFFAGEAAIAPERLPDGTHAGPNPRVFHLGNLALHTACVLLVFAILRGLFRHTPAACAGALLFGLHPVQVESVAWISETRGLLCAMFSLLAVWQYLGYAQRWKGGKPAGVRYGAATACFLLALLCKPAAVAVPLLVGVLELGQLRRPWRQVLLVIGPWLIAAAGLAVITKWLQPDQQLPLVPPLWARPLLAGDALAFYLIKLVWPWKLGPDYGRNPAWVMQQWSFYAAWALPAVVLAVLAWLRGRRVWLTAAAVSLVWVLPVLGLVPFMFQRISTVADRYLYLALLGPALALSWLLSRHFNRATIAVTLAGISALAVLSYRQTAHWHDNQALISHGLQVNPRSYVARQHRAHLLAKSGNHSDAVDWYRQALDDHPTMAELHLGLRASLVALGRSPEAIEALRQAVDQLPGEPILHAELGNELAKAGETDEAESCYREALRLDPTLAPAHHQWAKLLLERGRPRQAVRHLRTALSIAPDHADTHTTLASVLTQSGEIPEARYHYQRAIQIRPRDPAAHCNLANLLTSQGALSQAVDHYRTALQADPQYLKAHVNLGAALFELGKARQAVPHLRFALERDPDLVEARVHLGRALAAEGRPDEAAAELHAALRLVPKDSHQAKQIRRYLQEHGLAPPDSAGKPEWKSLFDGKTLGRWQVVDRFDFINHGKVEVRQGRLILGRGDPGTAVRFTGEFPKINYEVSLEAMRVDGEDFFCGMTFPVGQTALTLIVGGWGGPVVGLSCIDDELAAENQTCSYQEFDNRRWYTIRVCVTGSKVEAWIDREKVVDFATADHKLSIWFEPETALPLGIATWRTTGAVRNIRVRTLYQP